MANSDSMVRCRRPGQVKMEPGYMALRDMNGKVFRSYNALKLPLVVPASCQTRLEPT